MKHITNFLNNTTLTAGQQILVAIISSFIMIVLTPVLKNIYCILVKGIKNIFKNAYNKYFKPIKDKYHRNKRIKNGKTTIGDAKFLLSKEKSGQELSPQEKEALKKVMEDIQNAGKKMAEVRKIVNQQMNMTRFFK